MKEAIRSAAIVALAILGACQSQTGSEGAASNSAGDNAAAAKPPGEALGPEAESWVGRWSADGNCAHFMELGRDGTYSDYNGSPGTWRPVREHVEVYLGEQPMIVERMDLTRC